MMIPHLLTRAPKPTQGLEAATVKDDEGLTPLCPGGQAGLRSHGGSAGSCWTPGGSKMTYVPLCCEIYDKRCCSSNFNVFHVFHLISKNVPDMYCIVLCLMVFDEFSFERTHVVARFRWMCTSCWLQAATSQTWMRTAFA